MPIMTVILSQECWQMYANTDQHNNSKHFGYSISYKKKIYTLFDVNNIYLPFINSH